MGNEKRLDMGLGGRVSFSGVGSLAACRGGTQIYQELARDSLELDGWTSLGRCIYLVDYTYTLFCTLPILLGTFYV